MGAPPKHGPARTRACSTLRHKLGLRPPRRLLDCRPLVVRGRRGRMKDYGRLVWLLLGLVLGGAGVGLYLGQTRTVQAATCDRSEDYIICTGAVAVQPRAPSDG